MKFVYGAAAIVGLLAVLAFVAPYLIDWNWLKPTIATEAENSLGRPLAIDGEIEVRLLPTPRISVSDARLANLPGASTADMARAKRLDLELALGSLIGGRIEVTSVVLIDPVIELERIASGEANWRFVPKPKPTAAPQDATSDQSADSDTLGTAGLRTLELVNGSLTYRDAASGQVEHMHSVEASVVAREEGGPYQAKGRLKLREAPLSFDGTLGRGPADGAVPLFFVLRLDDSDATGSFSGTLDRATSKLTGTLDAKGPSLAAVLERFNLARPAERGTIDQPFSLTSTIGGAPDRIDLKDLDLTFGDTTASGALSYVDSTPPQLDVLLTLNKLDVDHYLGATEAVERASAPAGGETAGKGEVPASTPADAASATASNSASAGRSVVPPDLVASVNLTIDVVRYREAVIRSVQSILSLDKGTVTIQQASAELPGGGDASLVGRITTAKGRPVFEGSADLRTDDLRTLAAWLGVDLAGVSADRLRRFSMKAKLKADDRSVLVPRLDAKLDTSTLTGSVSIEQASSSEPGAKAQITANLNLDRLTLDAYLVRAKSRAATTAAGEGEVAGASPAAETPRADEPGRARPSVLDQYDVAGSVHVARLDYRDLVLTDVDINPLWRDGVLNIGELKIADFAGMAVEGRGTASALDSAAPRFDAKLNLNAASLGALGRALGLEPKLRLASLGRTSATATLAGGLQGISIDGSLVSEGGTVTLRGDITALQARPQIALDVAVENATDETLRALLGARPSAPTDQPAPMALAGRLTGDEAALTLDATHLSVGLTEVAGEIVLKLDGPRPYVRAALKSDHLVAPSVEGERLQSVAPAAGRPDSLEEQTARRAERAAAKRKAKATPARWSREPFDLSALGEFDGDLTLEAAQLSLGQWLAENASVIASLKDGTLDVTRFDARLFDGAFVGQAKVVASTRPVYAVEFTLSDADIDQLLRAVGEARAATGRVTLTGQLDAEGGSEHAIVSSLDGPIEVRGRDGSLEGIDLGAIRSALTNLDGIQSLTDLSGLAEVNLSQGSTPIHTLDGTVLFEGGVARTDDMKAVSDSGTCLITGTANLPRWHLDGTATCNLGDSASAPVGVRLVGPIDKPARQYQIDEFMAVVGKRLAAQALNNEGLKLKLRKGAKAEPGSVADQVLRNVFGNPDEPADDAPIGDDRPLEPPDLEEPTVEPGPQEPFDQPDVVDLLKRVVPDLVLPE